MCEVGVVAFGWNGSNHPNGRCCGWNEGVEDLERADGGLLGKGQVERGRKMQGCGERKKESSFPMDQPKLGVTWHKDANVARWQTSAVQKTYMCKTTHLNP